MDEIDDIHKPQFKDIVIVKFQCNKWYEGCIYEEIQKKRKTENTSAIYKVVFEKMYQLELDLEDYGQVWYYSTDFPNYKQYYTLDSQIAGNKELVQFNKDSYKKPSGKLINEVIRTYLSEECSDADTSDDDDDDDKRDIIILRAKYQKLKDEFDDYVLMNESKIQHHEKRIEDIYGIINKCMHDYTKILKHNESIMLFEDFGTFTKQAEEAYNQLPKHQLKLYRHGPYTCVRNEKGFLSCCLYKNLVTPCISKIIGTDGKYTSDKGMYMAMSMLGKNIFREMDAQGATERFSQYLVCTSCRNYFTSNHCINMVKRFENCVFCKKKRSSNTIDKGNKHNRTLPICSDCGSSFNDDRMIRESQVIACLEPLKHVFPQFNMTISSHPTFQCKSIETGKKVTRQVDILVSGWYGNIVFFIIIEVDPNQHKDRDPEKEKQKMLEQIAAIMKSAPPGTVPKIFAIRINNNSSHLNENAVPTHDYNEKEKCIIVRMHIIWYLMNLENMRTFVNMYMWYDYPLTSVQENKLLEYNFDGTVMMYHAPKSGPTKYNWKYCLDPSEVMRTQFQSYNNIINNAVDMDEKFEKWCDKHKPLPSRLVALTK